MFRGWQDPYKQLGQALTLFDTTPHGEAWRMIIDGLLGGRVEAENRLEFLESAQEGVEDLLAEALTEQQRACGEQALALCLAEQARVWQASALSRLPRRGRDTDAAQAVLRILDKVRSHAARSLGVCSR